MSRAISTSLSPRARAWNDAMTASPGDLDLEIPARDVTGLIPESLRGGRLLSNGPGWTLIGSRLAHPFDGHGYVRSFAFESDGAVRLRARYVRTPAYLAEERAQRIVVRGLGTNPSGRFWRNAKKGMPRNVANTTIYRWAGRLIAGWEGGLPYALDPVSLETLGPETFGGALEGQTTLAHMHHDARRHRLIAANLTQGRRPEVVFRELDADGALVQSRSGTLPGLAFAHDFAFTDSWYVLGRNPLALRPVALARAAVGAGTLLGAIRPDFKGGGELVLVPRDRQGPIRRVRLPDSAFVVHFANAFERDGELVIDACIFHRFTFGEEFGYAGPNAPLDPTLPEARGAQTLYRITVPAGAEEATWEPLVPHGVDFPRVHPAREGRATETMFGACRADTRFSDPFDSLIRVDLSSHRAPPVLWTAQPDVFVGEPVVAPGQGEDFVLALLSDGHRAQTTLAVFRADALGEGPVARVPMPLLPIAFHGDWDPLGAG